jgi:hypothetical protein
MMVDFTLDVSRTPFSRRGSYFTLAYLDRPHLPFGPGLYLRTVHGYGVVRPELFHISWLDGAPITLTQIEARPWALQLRHPSGGSVLAAITDSNVVRFYGERRPSHSGGNVPGLCFQMEPAVGVVVHPDEGGRWVFNVRPSYRRYLVEGQRDTVIRVDAPTVLTQRHTLEHDRIAFTAAPDEAGVLDVAIEEFGSAWSPRERPSFADRVADIRRAFEDWVKAMPEVAPVWRETMTWAAYVDWSCVVEPFDRLTRAAMYMSKNHMCNVWSWDHCFNAMALVYGHPRLAWDQLMLMVDQQDADGAFPDAVNDFVKHYNFSKPPVHGWALHFMRQRRADFFAPERLAQIYKPFEAWATWWLTYRVVEGERLPHYLHGNDSGWDNSTMFDEGVPLIAPDLAALLALHCLEVADLARTLDDAEARAVSWEQRAVGLIDALIETLWREDHFVAMRQTDHKVVESASLIPCIPIVLGERLPPAIRRALVAQIRRFVTDYGVATEDPASPHYTPDGYWRGPIWAPSTMLIVWGLEAVGETVLAREIAEQFCRVCAQSGFAENFDALTGEGLRDPAYTWTASVFMVLAHEYAS